MESFWGSLKNELVHHRRFTTREQATREITEYIYVGYYSPNMFLMARRSRAESVFLHPLLQ